MKTISKIYAVYSLGDYDCPDIYSKYRAPNITHGRDV